MKTVKSIAELKQMALARGASVSVGNQRFNTTGERVTAIPKREVSKPAEPAPTPAPVAAPEVNVNMAPVAQAQERMAQMLAQALASLPVPAAPVREWLFTVERDSNGLLTNIRATAQQ